MLVDNEINTANLQVQVVGNTLTYASGSKVKVVKSQYENVNVEEFDSKLSHTSKALKAYSRFFILGDDYFINVFNTVYDRNVFAGRIESKKKLIDFDLVQAYGSTTVSALSNDGGIYLYENRFDRAWNEGCLRQVISGNLRGRVHLYPHTVHDGNLLMCVYDIKDLALYKAGRLGGFRPVLETRLEEAIEDFTWSYPICSKSIRIGLLCKGFVLLLCIDLNECRISSQSKINRLSSTRSVYLDDNILDRLVQLDCNGNEVKE